MDRASDWQISFLESLWREYEIAEVNWQDSTLVFLNIIFYILYVFFSTFVYIFGSMFLFLIGWVFMIIIIWLNFFWNEYEMRISSSFDIIDNFAARIIHLSDLINQNIEDNLSKWAISAKFDEFNRNIKEFNSSISKSIREYAVLKNTIAESRYANMVDLGNYWNWLNEKMSSAIKWVKTIIDSNVSMISTAIEAIENQKTEQSANQFKGALDLQSSRLQLIKEQLKWSEDKILEFSTKIHQ